MIGDDIKVTRSEALEEITDVLQVKCNAIQEALELFDVSITSEHKYLSDIQKCRAVMKYVRENLA